MGRLNRDTVVALVLLAFCGAVFWDTFKIPEVKYASMGSAVWPRIVLAVLVVLSIIYLIQSLRQPVTEKTTRGLAVWFRHYQNPIVCFFFFFVFLLTLDYLGMLLGGILFVFATLTTIGQRTPRMLIINALIAIGTIGAMWSIFTFALNVFLPQGDILPI